MKGMGGGTQQGETVSGGKGEEIITENVYLCVRGTGNFEKRCKRHGLNKM